VDLVVSDIRLPHVVGYDLMQTIRQMPAGERGGAIPAIALTAYARTEDRTRAFRAGYQAHLAKPVEPPGDCDDRSADQQRSLARRSRGVLEWLCGSCRVSCRPPVNESSSTRSSEVQPSYETTSSRA
jgi:CheY-like chemotaxis protein